MELHLHSTKTFQKINGQATRAWEGKTVSGIAVVAFIAKIAVLKSAQTLEFDKELTDCGEPSRIWPEEPETDLQWEAGAHPRFSI